MEIVGRGRNQGARQEDPRQGSHRDEPPEAAEARLSSAAPKENSSNGPVSEEDLSAADWLLQAASMRIECAKVCAPAQLSEIIEGAQASLARVRRLKEGSALRKVLSAAQAEHAALVAQWQQRSGMIRVVVRVRPSAAVQDGEPPQEVAVKTMPGSMRTRGVTVKVPRESVRGVSEDVHQFKRFDYILGPEKDQEDVFRELTAMLPTAGPGGLSGPPQSSCILAYGQTGSGKTFTMQGATGRHRGLVPRVLHEVFRLAGDSDATISLSAVEVYNDIAYDLLDNSHTTEAKSGNDGKRAFQAGRVPPPPGLDFRHGCSNALGKATLVPVESAEEAHLVLEQAAERRSTRSTVFNATSSRSHSLVIVQAHLPNAQDAALRIAFVDLAGSERLAAHEGGGMVAEESKHINLSLSSLGSVIHALRHRSNHLPYRACLLTRLLEPFFGSQGRVLLCVCAAPEQKHAQETICSLAFADRASRAVLGADSAQEVQRGQALTQVREAHGWVRAAIRQLLPSASVASRPTTRLPDAAAHILLQFMAEHGEAKFVCRAWAEMCAERSHPGRELQRDLQLAQSVLSFLRPMDVADVCRCWWRASGAYRVIVEASSAKVFEASGGSVAPQDGGKVWTSASAQRRMDMWKALLTAGGGSGTRGSGPLASIRECVISGAPKPEALKQVLFRCVELRLAEVPEPDLVSAACAGLIECKKLRALKCSLKSLPCMLNLGTAIKHCKQLRVLVLRGSCDLGLPLQVLAEALPRSGCLLEELEVSKCSGENRSMELLSKACKRLKAIRLPISWVDPGESALSPPPLIPLGRLRKTLRAIDFRANPGRAYRQRPWLTDDMCGVFEGLRLLQDVRLSDQKLLSERCFWLLRRQGSRLRVLHLDGCKAMCGDSAFSFLQQCEALESLRLPQVVLGKSERNLGTNTNRWCQSLHCPRLRELCIDSWASLEDAGVQSIVTNCRKLRTLRLPHAPRLSNDAVMHLASLRDLANLSLACDVGLTNGALEDLASVKSLRFLDLTGCRQLTEQAVVGFARKLHSVEGPPLRSLRLDSCGHLGFAAAEALVSVAGLRRCSLSSCRPLPEAGASWSDVQTHTEACRALGVAESILTASSTAEEDLDAFGGADPPRAFERNAGPAPGAHNDNGEPAEPKTCAICLDEITSADSVWECPVCCNQLHNSEDCARGWLRLRQSCPTCRSAAWAPPEEPAVATPASNAGRRIIDYDGSIQSSATRRRPGRAASVDSLTESSRTPRSAGYQSELGFLSVAGSNVQTSQPYPRPSAALEAPALQSGSRRPPVGIDSVGRRPPRPSAGLAALNSAAARASSSVQRASSARARSVSTSRGDMGGFALVGASIIGGG
eukprot:TRINITY_DN56839_c0_g1_i1.p1 TRINITY_DN56839_c0_g1~~TRINITY_DN56839_c0_g1_i1.p1  ORF type:complete len:1357 (+),score=226.13 TRINITY_DN56839_c0_g1_i1:148-4218(+)